MRSYQLQTPNNHHNHCSLSHPIIFKMLQKNRGMAVVLTLNTTIFICNSRLYTHLSNWCKQNSQIRPRTTNLTDKLGRCRYTDNYIAHQLATLIDRHWVLDDNSLILWTSFGSWSGSWSRCSSAIRSVQRCMGSSISCINIGNIMAYCTFNRWSSTWIHQHHTAVPAVDMGKLVRTWDKVHRMTTGASHTGRPTWMHK